MGLCNHTYKILISGQLDKRIIKNIWGLSKMNKSNVARKVVSEEYSHPLSADEAALDSFFTLLAQWALRLAVKAGKDHW
jgi:hypothetical protein